ncbi:hypothetical protein I6N95_17985 [Vagococcus sp. BWB3-3]|uniref:Uncharacterized protein n=1 Tax=Vagococcus allomyrinae TaxID=2794353 RepID=A0A940PHA4_9ENTE|nr:hypothetical protein [Vagococcus allomyrinae]MBP1042908.1 hypothetical protein [Vagococcus allomyrinae]
MNKQLLWEVFQEKNLFEKETINKNENLNFRKSEILNSELVNDSSNELVSVNSYFQILASRWPR